MGNEASKPPADARPGQTTIAPPLTQPQAQVVTVVTAATPTAQLPTSTAATTANTRWSLPSIPFYSSASSSSTDASTLAQLPPGTNVDDLPVWYQDLIRLPKPSATPKLPTILRPASKPRSRPQTPASGSRPQTPSATTARTRQASDSPGAATNAANDDDGDRDSTLQSSTTSLSTSTQTNVPPGGVPSRGASWLSLFATSSTSPNPSSPLTSPSSSSSRSSSAPLADAPLVVGHLGHATNAHLKRVAATQRKLSTLVVDVQGQVTGVAGEAVLRARRAGAVVSGVRDYVGLQSRMDALDKELEELIFKVGEVVGKDKVKFLDPASESETEHEDGTSIPNA